MADAPSRRDEEPEGVEPGRGPAEVGAALPAGAGAPQTLQ